MVWYLKDTYMTKIFNSCLKLIKCLIVFKYMIIPIYSDSIFSLSSMESNLNLKIGSSICRVKQKGFSTEKNIVKKDCEVVNSNILKAQEILRSRNPESKEIIYAFYSENGDRETPLLSNEKNEYKLLTIIFNKKENKYKLEIIDKNEKYFYLEKKIDLIKLKE
jgi:hypothetical protein